MGVASAVDGFQRRHPVLGFPIAVVYKFFDDQGVYLAALITYYGFLSLFPLLLLLASALGFVLRDDPDLQRRILDSTISQFPVIGDQLRDPRGLEGSGVALVVGAIVALYGALGVGQALQNALNIAWAVPRNDRPNPLKARLRSILIILTGGIAAIATTTVSVLAGALGAPGGVMSGGAPSWPPSAAVLANTAILVVVFRIGTRHPHARPRRAAGRRLSAGGLAADAAVRLDLHGHRGQGLDADVRRVRPRARPARLGVRRRSRRRARHRAQRRALASGSTRGR